MAEETPLIRIDTSRIQQIAVKAITKKYVKLKRDDLTFGGILFGVQPDGSESLITVIYKANDATNSISVSNSTNVTVQTKSIDVALSNAGEVMNVSEGEVISSQAK